MLCSVLGKLSRILSHLAFLAAYGSDIVQLRYFSFFDPDTYWFLFFLYRLSFIFRFAYFSFGTASFGNSSCPKNQRCKFILLLAALYTNSKLLKFGVGASAQLLKMTTFVGSLTKRPDQMEKMTKLDDNFCW
jgi:hypothetical protein